MTNADGAITYSRSWKRHYRPNISLDLRTETVLNFDDFNEIPKQNVNFNVNSISPNAPTVVIRSVTVIKRI